jgi:hypothetical protein
VLPPGGVLLDLMRAGQPSAAKSSGETIGHGMNAAELAANPRLSRWFARTSIATATALADASVDAA